jgi:thiosulfate/3-mercaptopyruvate sulfurtransferase
MSLISPQQLRERLAGAGLLIIDARLLGEYQAGHIPSARHLDAYDYLLERSDPAGLEEMHAYLAKLFASAGVSGDEEVVLYDGTTGMRAARSLWFLEYLGHPRVRQLDGGYTGWLAAGGPASRDIPAAPRPAAFAVNPRPEVLATCDYVAARLNQPDVVILDIRREGEHTGTEKADCCPRAGRIPGSRWLEWGRLIDPQGRFPDGEQARRLLADAGITADKEIIVYCHRGARAANTYLALQELGYPRVRNFVGSWHEWSRRPDLPADSG